MPLTFLTGRADDVRARVILDVNKVLTTDTANVILLVPQQFTLQAEIDVLIDKDLPGSFQLQVLSPQRLYAKIFDQAGWPKEARIDAQGRIMLLHTAATRLKPQLQWYESAVGSIGFSERVAKQIALFKQADLSPEDISNLAQTHAGSALSKKLGDLALLYEAYEAALSGRFMDGEDENVRAIARMNDAQCLQDAVVFVHGFDLLTPQLIRAIVGLCTVTKDVIVALTLENDPHARDFYLFEPLEHSFEQLHRYAKENGISMHRDFLKPAKAQAEGGLRHLERELFCVPVVPYDAQVSDVQLALCKNMRQEAEFAAAVCRILARTRGYRYREMAIAMVNPDEATADALKRAFALFDVPLFLASGRSSDRHPLAICLLSALRAVTHGITTQDIQLYIRSGFSCLSFDEEDTLINYALKHGIRFKKWAQPFTVGEEDECLETERLRQKVMTPLMQLYERLRDADSMRSMLESIYQFLEDINAYDTLERNRAELEAQGLGSWAMEGAQVWQRIVSALDQMDELLSGQKITLKLLFELTQRALSEAVVKALPQSGDSVEGGNLDHLKGKPLRALIVVGASDASAMPETQLLDELDLETLGEQAEGLSRLSCEDFARVKKLNLKSLLALTDSYFLVTCPQSDAGGRAVQQGMLIDDIKQALPAIKTRGGIQGDDSMRALLLQSPSAAFVHLPELMRQGLIDAHAAYAALADIPESEPAIQAMHNAKAHAIHSEPLSPSLSRAVFGSLSNISASRLERFAQCPFSHFAHYALRPEEFRVFEFSARDAGSFYHEALELFVRDNAHKLGELTPEEAQVHMDEITDGIVDRLLKRVTGYNETELMELNKLRSIARRSAMIITRQFDGSRFRPVAIEADLGSGDLRINLDEGSTFAGRIDRIDAFEDGTNQHVRIIDYKKSGRALSLNDIYYGLQLQLIIYLATSIKEYGGKPAGVFYFNVDDPLLAIDDRDPETVEVARERQLRLNGLMVNDEHVVRAMATQPELVVPVNFNKNGSVRASDKLLEPDDFHRLIDHTLTLSAEMLENMQNGDTQIAPAQTNTKSACTHCEFATLCQYDDHLPGAKPRKYKNLSAKDVLALLSEKEMNA